MINLLLPLTWYANGKAIEFVQKDMGKDIVIITGKNEFHHSYFGIYFKTNKSTSENKCVTVLYETMI